MANASVASVSLLSDNLSVRVIIKIPITTDTFLHKDTLPATKFYFEPKVQAINMGQIIIPNLYGGCGICQWDPFTPQNLTVLFADVKPPTLGGFGEGYNGLHTLKAIGPCKWCKVTPCLVITYTLGVVTTITVVISVDCTGPPWTEHFFIGQGQLCDWEFDNAIGGDPRFFFHDGTAFVNLNLTVPAGEAVPDWGMLPDEGWKYEHMQAADDLEQYYIGSRKYKTNCRILFDPDQVNP